MRRNRPHRDCGNLRPHCGEPAHSQVRCSRTHAPRLGIGRSCALPADAQRNRDGCGHTRLLPRCRHCDYCAPQPLTLPPRDAVPEPASRNQSRAGQPAVRRRWRSQFREASSYAVTKPTYQQENLSGFRSLKIDVQQTGMDERQLLTFSSLGADPQIGITLARRNRNEALVWGVALAVFVLGVALTRRPVRQKVALVLGLALASALLPLAWDTVSMARICNGVFYAASLLVPYYLAAGLVRWILQRLRGLVGRIAGPAPRPLRRLVLALVTLLSATAQAQPQPAAVKTSRRSVRSTPPVAVPGDAIIVPYDVKSKTGVQGRRSSAGSLRSLRRALEPGLSRQEDRCPPRSPALRPFRRDLQRGARRRGNAERHRADANRRLGRGLRLDSPRPPRRRAGPGRPGRQTGPIEGRQRRRTLDARRDARPRAASRPRPWTQRCWCCKFPARGPTSWSWKCG